MDGIITHIINNLEIEKLTKEKAQEALYYIGMLIDQESDENKILNLLEIKKLVLNRINYLNML